MVDNVGSQWSGISIIHEKIYLPLQCCHTLTSNWYTRAGGIFSRQLYCTTPNPVHYLIYFFLFIPLYIHFCCSLPPSPTSQFLYCISLSPAVSFLQLLFHPVHPHYCILPWDTTLGTFGSCQHSAQYLIVSPQLHLLDPILRTPYLWPDPNHASSVPGAAQPSDCWLCSNSWSPAARPHFLAACKWFGASAKMNLRRKASATSMLMSLLDQLDVGRFWSSSINPCTQKDGVRHDWFLSMKTVMVALYTNSHMPHSFTCIKPKLT